MNALNSAADRIKLDREVFQALEGAVHSTLTEMFSISPNIGACKFERDGVFSDQYIYSSMKMNQSNIVCGMFVMGFSRNLISIILEKNGLEGANDPVLINDCVEELTNMIYGRVKKALNKMGYSFTMELPEIISDTHQFIQEHADKEMMTLPFLIDGHSGKATIAAVS